ncbi:hypothetical protein WR25_08274 isoform C [Diploscapter pachys]|uniref:IFT121/TULP4 N-terminal domain-containing protein n=1 Tax=Diploscapter pachys TaxID=2018661 RepID=A0A2A2LHQ4_9BILA|nr:hypothetical protein WR25_08274 isoform C [Diploscapter pachys]
MKIQWESDSWPGAKIEPGVTFLSWIPTGQDDNHGLLGVGSESGSVGITATDLLDNADDNSRYNYNLRGHHSQVRIITWNRAQCKLASCDTSGIIYVWVKNDDRWSVELVNDRGVKVNDLSWSPCGSSALICYEDNFVLIGSATGQRVWSNTFPTGSNNGQVNCGVWAPDSRQVVIGFSTGIIQVLSDQGANIAERTISSDAVTKLSFSPCVSMWTLAVLIGKKRLQMMRSYDEAACDFYEFRHSVTQMQWNQSGTLLALINTNHELLMLDYKCRLVHREKILFGPDRELSALTWAHGDSTIIVASGGAIGCGRIVPGVPKLFELVAYELWKHLGKTSKPNLPLPKKEIQALKVLDHHVIRCRVPSQQDLHRFVCSVSDARVYCTIRPLTRGSHTYILCMEHMGGLVPLLIGRQVNRFLPQFYISLFPTSSSEIPEINGSSAQVEDATIISRATTGRNSLWRRSKRHLRAIMSRHLTTPRHDTRLAVVNSNVWCTKFQISSTGSPANNLPNFLGQVAYKTSVLHLQPRQMTITLAALFENEERQKESRPPTGVSTECVDDDDTIPLLTHTDDGLTKEEKDFFEKVVSECTSLRAAMDAHKIKRNSKTHTSARPKPKKVEKSSASAQEKPEKSSQNSSPWHEQIEQLDFIDDADEAALLPSTSKDTSLEVEGKAEKAETAVADGKKEKAKDKDKDVGKKETDDIKEHIDRLATIAGQLRYRQRNFDSHRDMASMNKMKTQMKELLRRVNDIEKKVIFFFFYFRVRVYFWEKFEIL